jgi:lipoate-protein ligase A
MIVEMLCNPKAQSILIDFKTYNIPIVKSLVKLGVDCELSGRNDIVIDGKKFSGIAQSIIKGRVLNRGTLLFDSKLDTLCKALNVKRDKIESKGVKSVSSRVTNIKPYVKYDINEINMAMEDVSMDEYLDRITKEEFLKCLFS